MEDTDKTVPKIEQVEGVVVEAGSLERIERVNVDSMIDIAHRYPRSLTEFRTNLIEAATVDIETAESCFYCKPVGKDEFGKQKYAEGPSVRLMEMAAPSYKNLRVEAHIVEMTPRYVKGVGMAFDLETNYAVKCEVIEATVYNKGVWKGQPYTEGHRITIAKAVLAKCRRDVTAQHIRPHLKAITNEIRKVINGKKPPVGQRRAGVLDWIAKLPIDEHKQPFPPDRIYSALGVKGVEDMGDSELDQLRLIIISMQQGETNLDEAFPPIPVEADQKKEDPKTMEGRLNKKLGKKDKDAPPEKKDDSGASQTPPATK